MSIGCPSQNKSTNIRNNSSSFALNTPPTNIVNHSVSASSNNIVISPTSLPPHSGTLTLVYIVCNYPDLRHLSRDSIEINIQLLNSTNHNHFELYSFSQYLARTPGIDHHLSLDVSQNGHKLTLKTTNIPFTIERIHNFVTILDCLENQQNSN